MNTKPCYNCPDRYPGCHSKCQKEDYQKDRARRQLIVEGRSRERRARKTSVTWFNRSTGKMEE